MPIFQRISSGAAMKYLSPSQDPFAMLLGRHISALKVGWQLEYNHEKGLYLGGFGRFGGKPGNGAIALREICAMADTQGKSITLHADNENLMRYYTQFGFVRQSEHNRLMVRQPRKASSMETWSVAYGWMQRDAYYAAKARHYRHVARKHQSTLVRGASC